MIKINRNPSIKPRKAGPTLVFWGIIAALLVAVIAIAGLVAAGNARAEAERLAARPVFDAVDYALTVARQTATALGTEDDVRHVREVAERLSDTKDALSRAEETQNLIGELLSLAKDNQAATDELNGAKNRVQIAVRDYKNIGSGGFG